MNEKVRFSNFTEQDKKELRDHLSLLEGQAAKYQRIENDDEQRMMHIKEIAELSRILTLKFGLDCSRVLNYAVHNVLPIRQNEFKEKLLEEWLRLHTDAEKERLNDISGNSRNAVNITMGTIPNYDERN